MIPLPLPRALAHRNYRLFLLGQSVSLIGTWMQQVGLTWLVYKLTDSAALLGLVGFSSQIPTFFFAPLAGVMADRWNRHRALLASQSLAMAQAVALVVLTATGRIQVWHIIVLSLVAGLINAFDIPLRQSFVVDMVPKRDDLPNAIALNSSIVNLARLVGPATAGLLIAVGGTTTCFAVNAASYLAVLTALLLMRDLPRRQRPVDAPLWHGLMEGFRYAFGFSPIRALLMLMALVSVSAVPLSVLLPVFAKSILGGGPTLLGFLMAASGIGALMSAIYLASRRHILGLGKQMTVGVAVLGVAMIVFSHSRNVPLSLGLMAVSGFCLMFQMATTNTLLQTMVDEDKRGRVMSLYATAFMGAAPLGSLLGGTVADRLGAPLVVRCGGVACIVGAAAFALALPRLRQQVHPIYQRIGILPPVAAALQTSAELMTPPEKAG